MTGRKSSTGSLYPILFTPPELRQVLSAYSEGVLQKHWKDYGFQTAPKETVFAVIDRAGQDVAHSAILCCIKKTMPAKSHQDPIYTVYNGEKPVFKNASFLQALTAFRALNPRSSVKNKGNLKLISKKNS